MLETGCTEPSVSIALPFKGKCMGSTNKGALVDTKIDIKFKLSALWASLMFCYVYGDFFGLFKPGRLQHMLDGQMGPLGQTTQGVLVGTAALMAIPSLMVALTLILKPGAGRWTNIVFGTLYTAIMLITMPGSWAFYLFLGVIEVLLTATIVWQAWKWPRQAAA